MNSVQAIDFALPLLRKQSKRLATSLARAEAYGSIWQDVAHRLDDTESAITTLEELRNTLSDDEATRKCTAWIGCGNLAVPISQLSFRGFCPDCEQVATSGARS